MAKKKKEESPIYDLHMMINRYIDLKEYDAESKVPILINLMLVIAGEIQESSYFSGEIGLPESYKIDWAKELDFALRSIQITYMTCMSMQPDKFKDKLMEIHKSIIDAQIKGKKSWEDLRKAQPID